MEFQISLKVLIKNKAGQALLLHSLPEDYWMGKYDLPGGRINTTKLPTDYQKTIIRELAEEIGVKVRYDLDMNPVAIGSRTRKRAGKPDIHFFYVLFQATYKSGAVSISDEHSGYTWKKIGPRTVKQFFYPSLGDLMSNYFKWKHQ